MKKSSRTIDTSLISHNYRKCDTEVSFMFYLKLYEYNELMFMNEQKNRKVQIILCVVCLTVTPTKQMCHHLTA